MLSDLLPDPWLGLSHHQWGILLGGIVAGLLAIIGVFLTLGYQGRQFRRQENSNAEALEKQLTNASAALSAQLTAQSQEASKQREFAARGDVIAGVHHWDRVRRMSATLWPEIPVAYREVAVAIARWRLELQQRPEDRELWAELEYWPEDTGNATDAEFERSSAAILHAAMHLGAAHGNAVFSSRTVASMLKAVREGGPAPLLQTGEPPHPRAEP